jgi:hypothetical protein
VCYIVATSHAFDEDGVGAIFTKVHAKDLAEKGTLTSSHNKGKRKGKGKGKRNQEQVVVVHDDDDDSEPVATAGKRSPRPPTNHFEKLKDKLCMNQSSWSGFSTRTAASLSASSAMVKLYLGNRGRRIRCLIVPPQNSEFWNVNKIH